MAIHIQRGVPEQIAADFGAIVRTDRLSAILDGVARHGGTIVAALRDRELCGYATLVPSTALARERWENLPDVAELGSIEVARSARRRGIATALLAELIGDLDALLVLARGIHHHWDTSAANLAYFDYRAMLLRMLARAGFERWPTADPEVDRPPSFFAVRVGARAPAASLATLRGACG